MLLWQPKQTNRAAIFMQTSSPHPPLSLLAALLWVFSLSSYSISSTLVCFFLSFSSPQHRPWPSLPHLAHDGLFLSRPSPLHRMPGISTEHSSDPGTPGLIPSGTPVVLRNGAPSSCVASSILRPSSACQLDLFSLLCPSGLFSPLVIV